MKRDPYIRDHDHRIKRAKDKLEQALVLATDAQQIAEETLSDMDSDILYGNLRQGQREAIMRNSDRVIDMVDSGIITELEDAIHNLSRFEEVEA